MDDLISRQAAIDALEREKSLVERPITETRWFDLGLGKAQDVLNELPSAQPEPKTGRWLTHSDFPDRLICSECGVQFDMWHWESKQMHFCPNCGVKMI